jgi:hypothetical protein
MLQRFLAGAIFGTLITFVAPTAQVFACSCIQMNQALALSNADVAFVGVVAAIDDPGGGPLVGTGDLLRYTFAVEQTMKGEAQTGFEVLSARSSASCGMEFAAAQRWRVYAYAESGKLQTGLCSGNELLAERVPIPPIQSPPTAPPPAALLVAIGALIVLAGISGWAFTRRSRSAT